MQVENTGPNMICVADASSLKIIVDNKFNECTELTGTYYILSRETFEKLSDLATEISPV